MGLDVYCIAAGRVGGSRSTPEGDTWQGVEAVRRHTEGRVKGFWRRGGGSNQNHSNSIISDVG